MIVGGHWKIPEAARTLLSGKSYSETVAWSRKTLPYTRAEAESTLRAVVAPISRTTTTGTRAGSGFAWRAGVFVLQQIIEQTEALTIAKQDALLTVADEITNAISTEEKLTVDGEDYAMWLPNETTTPIDFDALRERKVFVSVVEFVVQEG